MRRASPSSLVESFDIDAPHVTEARRLLQALARHHEGTAHPILLTTSAGRGEGKSTICSLLGIVASRIFQKRTLIVDADLRRPAIHRLLGMKQTPGLTEMLHGGSSLEGAVANVPLLPTLSVIPSGTVRGPIGEMYDDERFRGLLEQLRPAFDLILIDAAPVVPVVEPLLMSEHADGILIVVMAGRTPLSLVRRMREILSPIETKIRGVILNNAAEGLPYYYDYRFYGYKSGASKAKKDGAPPESFPAPPRERRATAGGREDR